MDVKDKVIELGVELPAIESFWKIGDLTALRHEETHGFYRSNYERGLLLYSLVSKYRPRVILEYGTGRGYGALCMARALADNGIDGRVYTIDLRHYDEKQAWAIDYGYGPRVEELSLSDIWPQHAPVEWLDRIQRLNGRSVEVMKRWKSEGLPKVEFAFIDGGHDYLGVKHDFYSMLNVAAQSFRILFDDYVDKPGFGVCKLIDEEVAPVVQAELIWSDGRWCAGAREQIERPASGMVFVDGAAADSSFPIATARAYLVRYRRRLMVERWMRHVRGVVGPVAKHLGLRRRHFDR